MRRVSFVGVAVAGMTFAIASPPPPPDDEKLWEYAVRAASADLQVCSQMPGARGIYGDVDVERDRKTGTWKTSASKSLGSLGAKLAACVRTAIESKFKPTGRGGGYRNFSHGETIGTPRIVLPAAATLIPVWRKALGGDAKARAELVKLLPPDYTLTKDTCLSATRGSIRNVEHLWLPTVGAWVPRLWEKLLPIAIGYPVHIAMWNPAGYFVVQGDRGTCLEPFDAAKQTVLRAQLDTLGSCWAGSFEDLLLHPRVAFPADKKYTAVSTNNGRACAITTAGDVMCCGPTEPALPPAPKGLTSIALGYGFACGLDNRGAATCWGKIDAPPPGKFTKLSATYAHACGVRANGQLACWGTGNYDVAKPPKGTFVDVAAASFSSCGVHKGGRVECWGEARRETSPPGKFTAVAGSEGESCGVRVDKTIGCWGSDGGAIQTPLPDPFVDVVVGSVTYQFCGRRPDRTAACWSGVISPRNPHVQPPPPDKLVQIAGDHEMFCGVRDDAGVSCWGEPWPTSSLADNKYPYGSWIGVAPTPVTSISVAGRVVDEAARPIANAEVIVCTDHFPCTAIEHAAIRSPGKLADLIPPAAPPGGYALATTDADGRWSATIAMNAPKYGQQLRAVATAPGRELGIRVAGMTEAAQLAPEIALRPAAMLDVDARCSGAPCSGKLVIGTSTYDRYEGSHIERLAPGTYTIELHENPGKPEERSGSAVVEVTYAAKPQRVKLVMKPVGTGKSIRGTAKARKNGKVVVDQLSVSARCGPEGRAVYRDAKTDASGAFEILDVGDPPCTVEVSVLVESEYDRPRNPRVARDSVIVTKLPAKGITLDAR